MKSPSPVALRATSLALGATLDATPTEHGCARATAAQLFAVYAVGTGGTGAEILVEISPADTGDDWYPAEEILDTPASVTGGAVQAVASDGLARSILAAAPRRSWTVDLTGARRVRVRALETGSPAPAGTLGVQAVFALGGR